MTGGRPSAATSATSAGPASSAGPATSAGSVRISDPDAHSTRLRRLYEAVLTGGPPPDGEGFRSLISASWRRSLAAGVDPCAVSAPPAFSPGDVRDIRSAHPMGGLLPLITGTLLHMADETAHVLIVTDAEGRVLWRGGSSRVMGRADEVGLADGFHWGERMVGTNGIGTALATGRPVHVCSAEHLLGVLHPWSCSSAPITDPDSGDVLGCIDISGVMSALHPATVALVETTARLAESHLQLRMRERDDRFRARHEGRLRALRGAPGALVTATGRIVAGDLAMGRGGRIALPEPGNLEPGTLGPGNPGAGTPESVTPDAGNRGAGNRGAGSLGAGNLGAGGEVLLPDGRAGVLEPLEGGFLLRLPGRSRTSRLILPFLGAEHPWARLDGVRVPLSPRHAEILALLALNPRGLTADRLSLLLYGDAGNPVTARAEIHRLRAQLGPAVAAKPYRLTCAVEADFLTLKRLLAAEDTAGVAEIYRGPLLPASESPAIRGEREELDGQVHACLLRRGTPDDLWAYAGTEPGRNDVHVLERLVAALPADDPRAVTARIRLAACDP